MAWLLIVLVPQEDGRNYELHGFVLGNASVRTGRHRPRGREGGDFLVAEERLRLDFEAWAESVEASARAKVDFLHDAVAGRFDLDVREVYVDYATGPLDFRLGRQVVTWGVGDFLFINDVFPKDWESFLAGRPLEYLKRGVDGLGVRLSTELVNAELVVVPFFRPDNFPSPRRFVLRDPLPAGLPRDERLPRATLGETELGLRLHRRLGAFDVSLYAYRGYWRTPGARLEPPAAPARVVFFYPELGVYGASAQGQMLGGVVSLEAGYYDSWGDRDGDNPTVPNSQVRLLGGYSRPLWEDFTLGLQYYAETMRYHEAYLRALPAGFPPERRYRDTLTVSFTQLLKEETLRLSLFVFLGTSERDALVQPQVHYKLSDALSVTVGANVFAGRRETTAFGRFQRNDNMYLAVRFDF